MKNNSFVPKGNQNPLPTLCCDGISLGVDAFKKELQERNVCPVYLAHGNHVQAFRELLGEPHLLKLYLQHRRKLLHDDAMEQARFEYEAIRAHPFAM